MTTLALIGHGRWGANIQRTLEQLPGCRLKYVETHGWKRLLANRDLDGVLIATPAFTHYRIAQEFITRGIPTFIEKPLTTSLPDAQALKRLADRKRVPVMVGHIHLYNPAYLKTKEFARKIGRIRAIVGEGVGNGPFRDDISVLWDWAPHDVAMCLDLLGSNPVSVAAWAVSMLRPRTRLYDLAMLRLTFPGEIVATITSSWLSPIRKRSLTIFGTKSTLIFDDTATRKITLFKGLGPILQSTRVTRQEPTISYPSYGDQLPLAQELRAFLASVKGTAPPRADLAQGIAVIRILEAAERSLQRKGIPVRISRDL